MIVCLHGAGVGALIVYVHVVYLDAVLGLGVGQDDHAVVYRPLVIAGIQDGAAVQPRYPRDPVIHSTPGGDTQRVTHLERDTQRASRVPKGDGSRMGVWLPSTASMETVHAMAVLPCFHIPPPREISYKQWVLLK